MLSRNFIEARDEANARRRAEWHREREFLAHEVEFLLSSGESVTEVVKALGYSKPGSLARRLYRHGRNDLANLFTQAERRAA